MATKKAQKTSTAQSSKKSTAKKTGLNQAPQKKPPGANKKVEGAPPNEQDPKRRLGNFEGAGEHSRVGGRTSGIVGQTKQKFATDKKSTDKKSKSKRSA